MGLPKIKHHNFPGGSDGRASVYNVRDLGSIPGLGRFPGEGNGNPLQYFLPWKSHGRRSLVQATIHGVTKSRARLSDFTSFRVRLDHESGTLMMGLKRGRSCSLLSTYKHRENAMQGHWERAVCKPGRGASPGTNPAGTLILHFQSPKLRGNTFWLFYPPGVWYCVMAAWAD